MDSFNCCPDDFAEWLEQRHESDSLKAVAYSAIDAYRRAHQDPGCASAIEVIYLATRHNRFVVWDVGLSLLSHLGESNAAAREKLVELSKSKTAEFRRRSVQCITDRFPREFCSSILARLLVDRSFRVREFATSRIADLHLEELLANLEAALRTEKNTIAKWTLEHVIACMRDGYHYDESRERPTLWLHFTELYPARTQTDYSAQARFERGEGIEKIRQSILTEQPDITFSRREWMWPDE